MRIALDQEIVFLSFLLKYEIIWLKLAHKLLLKMLLVLTLARLDVLCLSIDGTLYRRVLIIRPSKKNRQPGLYAVSSSGLYTLVLLFFFAMMDDFLLRLIVLLIFFI